MSPRPNVVALARVLGALALSLPIAPDVSPKHAGPRTGANFHIILGGTPYKGGGPTPIGPGLSGQMGFAGSVSTPKRGRDYHRVTRPLGESQLRKEQPDVF